jgi:peptidoglycan hydrolase-like protein with peptidoglycan-binding domain
MYNRDVELIYPWIPIGTRVIITGTYHVEFRIPLRIGRVGQDVVLAQWALRDAGFYPGEANGTYDEETAAAVRELQKLFGLEPTGIMDETVFWLVNLP